MGNLIQPRGSTSKIVVKDFISLISNTEGDSIAFVSLGLDITNIKLIYDLNSNLIFSNSYTGIISEYSLSGNILTITTNIGTYSLNKYISGESITNYLKSSEGASSIGLAQGGTVGQSINYVTPIMFGAKGNGVNNDAAAIKLASDTALSLGYYLDGQGLTYAIGNAIRIDCGSIKNIKMIPTSTYTSSAPTFRVHPITGVCSHHNVEISGFKLTGTKIFPNGFNGIPEMVFSGTNKYNNNGNIQRTKTTANINTLSEYSVTVEDASIFSVNDYVQLGDARYQILSINGNTITFYNDGTSATITNNIGQKYLNYSGQYVLKNLGEDNNGIRIGDNTTAWNIKMPGTVETSNNGWSGFFIFNTKYFDGYHEISGIKSLGNGFIGIGLGYTSSGYVTNCISKFNGNNNIDTFESKSTYYIYNNQTQFSGVDGIFVGGNGECAEVYGNQSTDNQRIGILISGRTTSISELSVNSNNCLRNKNRSISLTAVKRGKLSSNKVGYSNTWSIFVEGNKDLENPEKIEIVNNVMYPSTLGDGQGNLRNNTSLPSGTVDIIDNNTFERLPVFNFTSTNYYGCKFSPECIISGSTELTAAAGGNIAVALTIRRPHNTTVTDAASVKEISMTISSNSDGTDQSTVTAANKNTTNAVELLNNATTQGKIIVIPSNGTVSYNFRNDTAGTRYLLVSSGGFRKLITLIWT